MTIKTSYLRSSKPIFCSLKLPSLATANLKEKKKLLDVFVLGNPQHANIVNIQTNSLISTNIEVLTSKYKGILNLSRYICFLCIAVDLMLCFYLMFGKLPF